MTLRTRISLAIISLVIITSLFLGFLSSKKHTEIIEEYSTNIGKALGQSIAESVLTYTIDGDEANVKDILQRIIKNEDIIDYIMVVDFDGKILASTFSHDVPELLLSIDHSSCTTSEDSEALNTNLSKDKHGEHAVYDILHTIVDSLPAHLHLGIKHQKYTESISKIRWEIFLTIMIVSIIGLLLAIYLGAYISRPLEILNALLQDFAEGKKITSPEQISSDPYIDAMYKNFRHMMEARNTAQAELQKSNDRLDKLNTELEQRVIERTRDLELSKNETESINRELLESLRELDFQQKAVDEHAIVSTTDANGIINYVNERFCNISGYHEDELIGKTHNIIKSDHHPKEFFQSLWQTISNGEVWEGEICNRNKDGQLYWVASTITPFLDENGKPYKYISIRTDITHLKNLEESLNTYKERLRLGQYFANIGTWDWDIQTGELFWSERIAPLFGYEIGELETSYDNFINAIHPDDRQAVTDAVNATIENDQPYEIEHRVVWPDGTVRWLLERGAVTRDSENNAIHMLGVVLDIDERKHVENTLRENQEKLNGLYSLSPLGIALTDMQGNFVEVNDAFARICGYSYDELKELDYWALTPQEYEAQENYQLKSLRKTGRYGPYEKVYRHKNGDLIPVRLNGILIQDSQEKEYIWSIVENITDIKRAEKALITARDEAEQANLAKSKFLSQMSHELRTPLNAILGLSQIYEHDQALSEKQRDNAKQITLSGNHLLTLINEVLDLSKIESGHLDLSIESIPLLSVINECLATIEPQATVRGITIGLKQHICSDAFVKADYTRLKQILLNLLSNAVKYNRNHGHVELSCEVMDRDMVRISVRDTGKGIPEDLLAELFTPFNRLDAEFSDTEGTGIGLVIVKQLAELMGGYAGVNSTPGEGSTFWFELKQGEFNRQIFKESADSTDSKQINVNFSASRKLLVAEDNKTNQIVIQQQLELLGIEADFADNGVMALKLWRNGDYELLLTDIHMPVMDGYKLVKNIRLEEQYSAEHIPIIAITANAMKEDRDRCLEIGMDDFISKPILLNDLQHVLMKWLPQDSIEEPIKSPSPEPLNISTIDINYLKSMIGNNYENHCKLLRAFDELSPGILSAIKAGVALHEAEKIAEECHKLKSSARSIGAHQLADVAQTLETACKQVKWDEINKLVSGLDTLFIGVGTDIKQYCSTNTELQVSTKPDLRHLKVMILDDDRIILDVEKMMLDQLGIEMIVTVSNGNDALGYISTFKRGFDVILCDLNMPEMDGVEFLRHLADRNFRGSVVLVSGEDERILRTAEKLATEHQLDVLGFVTKPVTPAVLERLFSKFNGKLVKKGHKMMKSESQSVSAEELEQAIKNDELVTFFQPKIDVASHKAVSMETLVRWQHPEKGIISPDHFISLAEENGLIDDLTMTVFKQAMQQTARLNSLGFDIQVAINLSVHTLHDLNWPDYALSVSNEFGVDPSIVTLEITESRLMDNLASALEILTRLSLKKFKLSVDDFGTGYSSMEQLQRAPFSELKIDRAFVGNAVNDKSSLAILESSVELAKKLNMKIVAEGVETREDWDLIAKLGCDEVQGYFIARPIPAQEIEEWLSQWENKI